MNKNPLVAINLQLLVQVFFGIFKQSVQNIRDYFITIPIPVCCLHNSTLYKTHTVLIKVILYKLGDEMLFRNRI